MTKRSLPFKDQGPWIEGGGGKEVRCEIGREDRGQIGLGWILGTMWCH